MFRGSLPALITPFKDGSVDETALASLIEWHIAEGSSGLVPVGTTGESPTLSVEEHLRVIDITIEAAASRVPVIAGAGSNNTAEAAAFLRHAKASRADAGLVVTPYYNKPTQRGLIAHFTELAKVGLPIVIYNIPGRSVVDMTPETMGVLAELPEIIGVKDATGDITRVSEQRATCGRDFLQLSGEDASALGFNAHGGQGCISVTANVAPRLCAEFQTAALRGDFATALEYQDQLMPLHTALFLEPGTVCAKYALSLMGQCTPEIRSPLTEATNGTKDAVRAALEGLSLI